MQTRRLVLLLLFVLASAVQAKVVHTTLDNGLTVLIEENHTHPVVSVQVFVRTGSIYEQEYLGSGISHFFEHVIHGGTTTTRSEAESRELLEAIGNHSNAYTTTDHTAYYITTTTEHWPTALELLADWMLHSTIEEAEFEREKGVVQREIEQGLDNPLRVLFQAAQEERYKVHPARYPVIGYKELVQQITRDDLLTYYRRMYAPNNMILVVVGDVQVADALARIRQAFGGSPRRRLPVISLPEEPPQLSPRRVVKEMDVAQAYLSLSFRTVPLTHPDLYPLDVLAFILAEGDSARLVRRLRDERQLVYRIEAASFTPAYAPGSLVVWATLAPEQLEAAEQAILQELYRLREEPVTPQELARAKRQKVADHLFAQQTVQGRARTLGLDMLSTFDPTFSDTYVQRIQEVTAADIRRVAQQYFREETLVTAVVRPPRAAASAVPAAAATSPTVMQKRVLPNGLTLLVQRNPALPIVAMQAYFKGGVRVETPETNGLSRLMARLLPKGTTSRRAEEIAAFFDGIGGSLTADSGNNSFYVHATCLREDFAAALEVFADVITHPTFPSEELAKMRRLMLAEVRQLRDTWQSEIRTLFRQTFFTVSPYRLLPEGSEASLARLQRQDVQAFYARYVAPSNLVLAIVGDVDVEETTALVAKFFADLPPRPVTFPPVPAEPFPQETRRRFVPTQKQVAAIAIGYPGTTLTNLKDRYPLHLLDAILSGIQFPGGWLHTQLRGQQLVYVVHAFNWLGLDAGYFGIIAATQPEKAERVVELILRNVEEAKAGRFSEAELARAKQLAVIAAQLDRQTNAELASDAALNELYGLGYDFSAGEAARIRSVSREDVLRVARTYLQHPTIVIASPEP
ncbi:MAG: peptidase M16 [Candidatus Tectimicrobiota bacterium]|nr:MAG: peptidase M16 [Candidatus Tectomicrobia bacterium]